MKTIATYITDHGFGHATRSCDLLAALRRQAPDARLIAVTAVSSPFVEARLAAAGVERRSMSFDVGLIQLDPMRSDPSASLAPTLEMVRARPDRVREEILFLRHERVSAVVSDIPSIPFEAAAALHLPGIGVGNFSWNWIYQTAAGGDPRWDPVLRMYEEGYARASLLIRLPFHEPMSAFRNIVDAPLFARPGRNRRAALAARFRAPPDTVWVLIAFSSLQWDAEVLRRVSGLRDRFSFWTVRPLEWSAPGFFSVDQAEVPFSDVLASCDVTLTKPGFGILSDSVVNNKPLACARREGFAEAAVLEEGLRRHLRHSHLSVEDLYAGRIEEALRAAMEAPPPPVPLGSDGAEEAARRILSACMAETPGGRGYTFARSNSRLR